MKSQRIYLGFCLCWIVALATYAQKDTPPSSESAVAENKKEVLTTDTVMLHDTIVIIRTACAPICSSIVYICNEELKEVGRLQPPEGMLFPEAYMDEKQLRWRDNDEQLLDEEEKRWKKR